MSDVHLVVHIDPSPRKSNDRKIVYIGKRCRVCKKGKRPISVKGDRAMAFVEGFFRQVGPFEEPLIPEYFEMETHIYYPTRRPDLSEELIQDCLEKCGIISNDRYLISKISKKHLDKENPRVEITLRSMDWEYADKRRKRR